MSAAQQPAERPSKAEIAYYKTIHSIVLLLIPPRNTTTPLRNYAISPLRLPRRSAFVPLRQVTTSLLPLTSRFILQYSKPVLSIFLTFLFPTGLKLRKPVQPHNQYTPDTTGLTIPSPSVLRLLSVSALRRFFSAFAVASFPFPLLSFFSALFFSPFPAARWRPVSGIVHRAFVFAVPCGKLHTCCHVLHLPTFGFILTFLLFPQLHIIAAGGDCGAVSRQFGRRCADNDIVDVVFNLSSSFFHDGGFWRLPCAPSVRCVASSCLFLFCDVASTDSR